MRMRTLSTLTLVAVISFAGSACGGGSDTEVAQAPSEIETALAEYFADPANGAPVTNQTDADCVAKEIVALFGDDTLRELGVSATLVPELDDMGMTDVQVGWVLSGFNNCIDLTAAFQDLMAEDIGDEAAACMVDALGETVINESLRASLANDTSQIENTNDAFGFAASFCGIG